MGRGEGFEFKSEIKGGAIPNEYISPIEKGIKEKMENGVMAGFPMVDMRAVVYDGSFHEVDSSEIAFKIAGSMALEDAFKNSDPILLEPIMKVEVSTPDEFMGDVIGDLSSKRAALGRTFRICHQIKISYPGPRQLLYGTITLRGSTEKYLRHSCCQSRKNYNGSWQLTLDTHDQARI
jgi:hypothetical protein